MSIFTHPRNQYAEGGLPSPLETMPAFTATPVPTTEEQASHSLDSTPLKEEELHQSMAISSTSDSDLSQIAAPVEESLTKIPNSEKEGNFPVKEDSQDTSIEISQPMSLELTEQTNTPITLGSDAQAKQETPEPQDVAQCELISTSSSLSPQFAAEICPPLDRSVSTASSISSRRSSSSRLSDPSITVKKRGYMRPQATNFSDSAKNRESVMSLGSIAHLQYYFARTGLLDGKGAQLARKTQRLKGRPEPLSRSVSMNVTSHPEDFSPSPTASSYPFSDHLSLVDSPIDQSDDPDWDRELALLPPTVSTYNVRPAYVPPPPDLTMLRRELTEALEDALKVLKESEKSQGEDAQGWYEIQGLHLLDITTLAIRAAKNYYTAHSQYQRLHAIKSERVIRQELYQVLEILKRMASRNFAGGIRQAEKVSILTWIVGISELIQTEINEEKREAEEREKWIWRDGDWAGREREREHAFIKCFVEDADNLPHWDLMDQDTPTSFLLHFQNGLRLVHLHNTLVRRSKRQFEEIKVFHTDTNKPYRCADNLRFWIKAAELRWDIFLKVDVMGVVQNSSPEAWRQFDAAILKWSQGVREEFTKEMTDARDANGKRSPPRLKVEPEAGDGAVRAVSAPVRNELVRSETI